MDLPINSDHRQHISLSTFAYNTIMSDMLTYENTVLKTSTLSGITNVIIRNSFDRSFASVSKNAESEQAELDALILQKFKSGSKEAEAANILRDALVQKHRDDLALRMNGFSKDHNVKIRLQKETVRLLENECEDDISYYKKSLTGYLKALLEDYARQNKYNRETILFGDTIKRLEREIDNAELHGGKSRALLITSANLYGNEVHGTHICKPYRITYENEIDDFPYLLCSCIDPREPNAGYIDALLPVFGILDIGYAPRKYGSAFLSAESKKRMDQSVAEHNGYMFEKRSERVLVSFTETGLNTYYHKNTQERPALDIKAIRKNGNHRYRALFNCPLPQAYNYFLPFGGDAIILQPKELSAKMADYHRKAGYLYSLNAGKHDAPSACGETDKDIELLKEADRGDDYAQTWNRLAEKYFWMTDSMENVEVEFMFYHKAAEAGFEDAYPMLADIYFENDFFKKDYKKAAYYYEQAFKLDLLDEYRTANYASLIINNLADGHSPDEGYEMLNSIRMTDRQHKETIPWHTAEGYTFYSLEYKKNDRAGIRCYLCPDGSPFYGKDSEYAKIWEEEE